MAACDFCSVVGVVNIGDVNKDLSGGKKVKLDFTEQNWTRVICYYFKIKWNI